MATRRRIPQKKELIPDRPESLLSLVTAGAQFLLMVVGIIGVTAAIFREGGLLATVGNALVNADTVSVVITAAIIVLALYLGHHWFEKNFEKKVSSVYGTLAMYLMMAFGAYYLISYLLG